MRVVAGTARGRPLRAPAGRTTRPTSDRVREAMFDMLTSMGPIEGASVADLFAGSGAIGIEALSRGASRVAFVDSDRRAIDSVRANLATVADLEGASVVERADAVGWVRGRPAGEWWDLVVADPPYAWDRWADLAAHLSGMSGLLVAETGGPWDPPEGWQTARARRYGSTVVTIVRPVTTRGER